MSTPTPEQRAWAVAHEFRDYLIHDGSTAVFNALVERVTAAVREAEPAAALLSELDELRTLAHDLLIDRDAAYGREVGRGEALTVLGEVGEEARRRELASLHTPAWSVLATAQGAVRALGPVRPLPPPERLAVRCRALEDALRGLALEADAAGRYVEVGLGDCPGGKLDVALDAARKLLEERGSGT